MAPFPLLTAGPMDDGTVMGEEDEELLPLLEPRAGTGRETDGWCWVTPGSEWLWRYWVAYRSAPGVGVPGFELCPEFAPGPSGWWR